MNEIQVFKNENFSVRAIEKDNEIWLIAKDVCNFLGLTNPTEALKALDDDEKMTLRNPEGHSEQRGGAQSFNVINEAGLYRLTFRSNKPMAKAFTRWVTHDVLPLVIRGKYNTQTIKALPEPKSLEILMFNYKGHDVRIFEDEEGERLVAWPDIVAVVGEKKLRSVKDYMKIIKFPTLRGIQNTLFIYSYAIDFVSWNKNDWDFYHWLEKEIYMSDNHNELSEFKFENCLFHVYQDGETFWFVTSELCDYFGIADEEKPCLFGFEEEYQAIIQGEDVMNDMGFYGLIRGLGSQKAMRLYKFFDKMIFNKKTCRRKLRRDIAKIVKAYK